MTLEAESPILMATGSEVEDGAAFNTDRSGWTVKRMCEEVRERRGDERELPKGCLRAGCRDVRFGS